MANEVVTTAAQALKHPLRVGLLKALRRQGTISASGYAGTARARSVRGRRPDIHTVSSHIRTLAELGVLGPVGPRPATPGRARRYEFQLPAARPVLDTVELLTGHTCVVGVRGEAIGFQLDDEEVARVAKAIAHPRRVAIMQDLRLGDETYSPAVWARRRGQPLANAAYHFLVLGELGVATVERTEEHRGTTAHLYGLKGPLTLAALTALDLLEGHVEPAPPADAEGPDGGKPPEGRPGDAGSPEVEGATGRPRWAARVPGRIIGENWRLGEDIGGEGALSWGVIWNARTGEVVAVQIIRRSEAGRSVSLGWVPRPHRLGEAVPVLIKCAEDEGIFYLVRQIQQFTEGAIQRSLIEAADEEDDGAGWAAPAGRRR